MDPVEKGSQRNLRKLGGGSLAVVVGFAMIMTTALYGGTHTNTLYRLGGKDSLRLFIPEGWKFFTRDAQEKRILVYHNEASGHWVNATQVNASPRNLLGLRRTSRAQGVELGLLLYNAPPGIWTHCGTDPVDCIEEAPVAAAVANPAPSPRLCGTIGVALQKPVPWAWSRLPRPVTMPSKVAKLRIQC